MKILIVCIILIVGFLGLSITPGFNRSSIQMSDKTQNISNMRSIQVALLTYYAANDEQYPDSLKQLISEKVDNQAKWIEKEYFELIDVDLYYIPNLNARDGEKIILYTTAGKNGEAFVSYVDGSVMTIEPEKLNHLLVEQGIAPIEFDHTEFISKTP